jgi:hypothetical protein
MNSRGYYFALAAIYFLLLSGCGDSDVEFFASFNGRTGSVSAGSTDGSSSGLVVVITDSKPLLPSGTEEVFITFEGAAVHREGGDWITLPLVDTPYTIDLLQFHSGRTTDLIQPMALESGTYDLIRLLISDAAVVRDGNYYPIKLPQGKLTIEEEFFFDVGEGGSVNLTIDFDLSQSLALAGFLSAASYELDPVLHINHSEEAATIQGEIAPSTFAEYGSIEATVAVILDKDLSGNWSADDEEYSRIEVDGDDLRFTIFWLVPEEGYTIAVDLDGRQPAEFEQFVYPADLQKGDVFELNQSNPI